MRDVPSIIYTETDRRQIQRATEDALHAMRFAEQREQKTQDAANKASDVAAKAKRLADEKRLAAGRALVDERKQYPRSGPKAKGWGLRLEELGLEQSVAYRLMQLAGFVDEQEVSCPPTSGHEIEIPSRREIETARREAREPDPPPANGEAPASQPPADRSGGRGKPQWLMRALVQDYSLPGDLVCDPLAGWGSTLRAALDTGRRAIGGEIDPKIAAEAGELPIHVGPWQESLAHVDCVDAIICDPPYSQRTHEASRKFGNAREDGSSLEGLGPDYAAWTRDHVHEFVRAWSERNRGWFVALTDHNLIHHWQDAYEEAGLYSFAPVVCLIRGMTVRLCGDGPSSWAIYAMVARPMSFSRWRTLTGGYVGSRDKLEIGDAA